MIKNNGACDLEYAKELRSLGCSQESIWYWENTVGQEDKLCWRVTAKEDCQFDDESLEYYSAPIRKELLETLPKGFYIDHKCLWYRDKRIEINHIDNDLNKPLDYVNALAKLKIWLIKNYYIKGG